MDATPKDAAPRLLNVFNGIDGIRNSSGRGEFLMFWLFICPSALQEGNREPLANCSQKSLGHPEADSRHGGTPACKSFLRDSLSANCIVHRIAVNGGGRRLLNS